MSLVKAKLIFKVTNDGKLKAITLREQEISKLQSEKNMKLSALTSVAEKLNVANMYDTLIGEAKDLTYGIGEEQRELTFQFNPSTLRISAYGGGMKPIYNFNRSTNDNQQNDADKKSGITYGSIKTHVYVEFKVIFDAERNTDAFMADKLSILSSATATAKAASDLISDNIFSVRQIVEGFLVMVKNHESRRVIFSWGDLMYEGVMNSVSCNYTMFNTSGEPIRAEVNIRILANEDDGTTGEWNKNYNTYYEGVANGVSNASNVVNNLFNFQL